MERPITTGWQLTVNENGVQMATLPAEEIRQLHRYAEFVESELQYFKSVSKNEINSKRIEGFCQCGCKTKIIKFENSNLTIFKHGHRFTTEDDKTLGINIFRCKECIEQIELSFVPS